MTRPDFPIVMLMSVVPKEKYDGYHTRKLFKEIDLPFVPFPGLQLFTAEGCILKVAEVTWMMCENPAHLEIILEDETVATENDIDEAADDWISIGWKDELGSKPMDQLVTTPRSAPHPSSASRP